MKKAVAKSKEKYVTESVFEGAMQSIARSFLRIEEKLEKNTEILALVAGEIRKNNDEHRDFRSTLMMHDKEILDLDRKIDTIDLRVKKALVKIK